MKIFSLGLVLSLLCAPVGGFAGQTENGAAPAQAGVLSGMLRPALDGLEQSVGALKLEKWKGGTVRDEAGANIRSILKDLQTTLPPIIAAADKADGKISGVLPVSQNVDALYDVVLRVVDGARIAGSAEQVNSLMQAMADLEKARRALDGHLTELAAGQEKQVVDLQNSLKAQAAPVCPVVAPPASTEAAPKKKVVKKKPKAAAPAPPPPGGANGAGKP